MFGLSNPKSTATISLVAATVVIAAVGLKVTGVVAQQAGQIACNDQLPAIVADPKLNETVTPVVRCLASEIAALRAENTALRTQMAGLASLASVMQDALTQQKTAIDTVSSDLAPLVRPGEGTVVAFDRGRGQAECPAGWELYPQAEGRFIVGAGNITDAKLPMLQPYAVGQSRSIGGEKGTSPEEILGVVSKFFPRPLGHLSVGAGNGDINAIGWAGATTASSAVWAKRDTPSLVNLPEMDEISNLPPYVALYYCRKSGNTSTGAR